MAIQDYVRNLFPDQRVDDINEPAPDDATGIFLDIHSSGGYVFSPYGFTFTNAPNEASLRPLRRRVAYRNNYVPMPISQFTIADGSTVDFAYGELGVAALAYEVGTTFFQCCSSFDATVAPDNVASLIYLAAHARTPYLTAPGPDAVNVVADVVEDQITVTAGLDDTLVSTRNGAEPVHNIVGAELFIDVPPWEEGAQAIPMDASDGSFNSPTELVQASFQVGNLEAGRHTVFVRGTDASGYTGTVRAAFFEVAVSYEGLLARWPDGVTVLDLINALP